MEENRGLLEENVELGSIEHVKKIKRAIQATFPEISKEIQEQLLLNVMQRKYPNIELNYDLVFDQIKYPEPSEYIQHFQKKFDELQSEYIEGMSEDLKKMFDTDGMLNYANAFHKETKTVVKEIEGVKTAVQEVVKVEDDWVKLKGKDWLNILPEETGDDIRKRLSATIKDVKTFKRDILQETTDIYEVVRAFNAFGIAEIIKVPSNATKEQIKQIRDKISSYSNLYEYFLKKAQKEVGGREEERNRAAKSYTSEFNTMINFIKKLNTETEKLGKTFDTHLSTDKYKSALEQVRNAFTSEFKSMPKEFQQMFSGLMENVDFSDRNVILQQLEHLKTLAKSGKYKKDAEEIIRNIEAVMSPMEAGMQIEVKTADDKELQRQVEDMFSDYEITVELQKLGIDADTAKSFFGLDYTDLNTLQKKIFEMQEQFTGADAVEKYRSYIDKLFKITDKANLDAVKKYSKYLQYEMSERVRVEMEYQRQMGEVYGSSAFTGEQKTDIIGNLEKEMKKKLQKMDWDEFKATDYYIEMFQNLEFASTSAINTMITKLADLRDSMSELDATQVKEITKQMEALEDEMIRRNPFQSLISSMKKWNAAKKAARDDEEYKSILPTDYEIESTGKMIQDVLNEIDKKLNVTSGDGKKGLIDLRKEWETIWQLAKQRDEASASLLSQSSQQNAYKIGVSIKTDSIDDINKAIDELTQKSNEAKASLSELEKPETEDKDRASELMQTASIADSLLLILGDLKSAYIELGDNAKVSANSAYNEWKNTDEEIEKLTKTEKKAKNEIANQKKAVKAIKELASVFQQVNEKSKEVFDSIMDNLDYIGSATDENTEAWKEFGDAIFDTVTSALTMIPMLVAGFDAAGTAINASMGIIGLIAEAIQLTITLVKALAKIHDNDLEAQITRYTKKIDDLKKAYDRYQKAFDAAWDYNKMRRFYDLAQATAERQIENYRSMIALEEEKKKSDEEKIEEWYNAIGELQEELLDNREKIMNELGGFGSEEDMGSAAEQFASAWYDAFLETGSGLQALEDTFQSFLENIVKKQLLLQGSQQILDPLFTSINEMLSDGRADAEEVAAIIDRWNNETIGQLNAYYESLGQMFQAAGVGGGLEGLQQGIQGVTEDTAAIIASYMNTIRFDVAQQNSKLDTIVQTLQLDTATNPLIHNLRIIAQQTTDIRVLLDSVVMPNHPDGGSGIKVFMD